MWDNIGEGVRDGVLIKGYYEFLRLVTLNSLGSISQLEHRGLFLITLKWGFYSINQNKIYIKNVYESSKYMIRGYPRVHTIC